MNKRIITKALFFLAIGALVGYVFWRAFPKYFARSEDPRSEAHLSKVAAEVNRSVPVMIDPETELLGLGTGPGMLIYNYRLVRYSAAQLDANKIAAGAKQRVTDGACNSPETRDDLLKNGVILRYAYFDKDKQPIAAVDVTPADCGF